MVLVHHSHSLLVAESSSLIDRFTNGIFQGSHTPFVAFLWDNPSHMKPPVRQGVLGSLDEVGLADGFGDFGGVKTVPQPPVASKGFMNAVGVLLLDGMQAQPCPKVIT